MPEQIAVIFNISLLFMVFRVSTPILLASIGGMFSDLAGSVNIALEGMMLLSALLAVLVSTFTGSAWLGVLAGMIGATLLALILGYFSLNLKADIIIVGIAINIFSSGFTVFLMNALTGEKGNFTSPDTVPLPNIKIPILDGIPYLGDALSGHNVLFYAALILVALSHWFLYKHPMGLRIRAVGENPHAAESVGVNVVRIQYIAIAISGLMSGLAGANLSLGYMNMFVRDMTAGRGFIALAAVLLGGRTPLGTFAAAVLFAFAEALSNVLQSLKIPPQVVLMLPYVSTVVALVVFSMRKKRQAAKMASKAA